jgi:uncharacterized membrane protein
MSNSWHYMKNGAQTGPATADEIKALLSSGAIKGDTLVWREGLASWVAASSQSEFAGVVPAAPPTPPATAGAAGAGVFTPDAADVDKNKIFGILAYLGILWLVPLLAAKESPFARYHTNQGIILFITGMGVWICSIVLAFIPILGWLIDLCLFIGMVVLWIMGIINAAKGECKPLPVIGNVFTIIKTHP